MRVAHILRKYVPAEWGGTETAIKNLTQGLAAQEAKSILFHPRAGKPQSDPLAAAGCEMRPFHAHLPIIGLSRAARQEMIAIGGNLLSFDLPWMLSLEPGLNVIHSHVLGRLGGIACTVARRRNIPFVVTIHGGVLAVPAEMKRRMNERPARGFEWGQLFGWWWRARHVLSEADAIITCNAIEADLLRARHPEQEIVVFPHGINTSLYRTDQREIARAAFPAVNGHDVIVTVARIDPIKNQLWLVRQLPEILTRHPKAMLVLVGSCTNAAYGEELRQEIARLGLSERVLLTGGLPPGDPRLTGLMQLARAAVLPSLNETFGLVILEAWAAGLPIIASRTSGSLELIRDDENGWLFDPADPAPFHARLDQALRNDPNRARLVDVAGRAVADFDIVTIAGRIKRLYERLSEEKHALRHSA